jgi:hypothetical protein
MPADIMEANRIGQKSYKLPWFWRIGDQVDTDELHIHMKDCEYKLYFLTQLTIEEIQFTESIGYEPVQDLIGGMNRLFGFTMR